jgi:hypothetical protein
MTDKALIWRAPNAKRGFSAGCYRRHPWEVRSLHAFGVDDSAAHALALRQILFFVWVTFAEHKWVILGERRGRPRIFQCSPYSEAIGAELMRHGNPPQTATAI